MSSEDTSMTSSWIDSFPGDEAREEDCLHSMESITRLSRLLEIDPSVHSKNDVVFALWKNRKYPALVLRSALEIDRDLLRHRRNDDDVLVTFLVKPFSRGWVRSSKLFEFPQIYRDFREQRRTQGIKSYPIMWWQGLEIARRIRNQLVRFRRNDYCYECRKTSDEENLLICSNCDRSCHTFCDVPPLAEVPESDWFCKQCRDGDDSSTLKASLNEEYEKKHSREKQMDQRFLQVVQTILRTGKVAAKKKGGSDISKESVPTKLSRSGKLSASPKSDRKVSRSAEEKNIRPRGGSRVGRPRGMSRGRLRSLSHSLRAQATRAKRGTTSNDQSSSSSRRPRRSGSESSSSSRKRLLNEIQDAEVDVTHDNENVEAPSDVNRIDTAIDEAHRVEHESLLLTSNVNNRDNVMELPSKRPKTGTSDNDD